MLSWLISSNAKKTTQLYKILSVNWTGTVIGNDDILFFNTTPSYASQSLQISVLSQNRLNETVANLKLNVVKDNRLNFSLYNCDYVDNLSGELEFTDVINPNVVSTYQCEEFFITVTIAEGGRIRISAFDTSNGKTHVLTLKSDVPEPVQLNFKRGAIGFFVIFGFSQLLTNFMLDRAEKKFNKKIN